VPLSSILLHHNILKQPSSTADKTVVDYYRRQSR